MSIEARAYSEPSTRDLIKESASMLSTFAFALPGPWGPIVSGELTFITGIFGSLFSSGPNLLDIVQKMIDAAVKRIENYMDHKDVAAALTTAKTFLGWSQNILTAHASELLTQKNLQTQSDEMLTPLMLITGPTKDQLPYNLTMLVDRDHFNLHQPLDRASDEVLEAIFLTVSVLILAFKLRIQMHALLASSHQPGPNGCASPADDEAFQTHTAQWRSAALELATLLNGPIGPTTADGPQAKIQQQIAEMRQAEDDWVHLMSTPAGKAPITVTAEQIIQKYGPSAPVDQELSALASSVGWISVIELIVTTRHLSRILAICPLGQDTRSRLVYIAGQGRGGSGGHLETRYTYTLYAKDSVGDQEFYHHEFREDRVPDANDLAAALQAWGEYAAKVKAAMDAPDSIVPNAANDFAAISGWRDGVAKFLETLPADAPANMALPTKWNETVPDQSLWKTAKTVQYAFSWLDAAGPSQRSDWGPTYEVGTRSNPTLHPLPDPGGAKRQLQVWRNFLPSNQAPKLLDTLDGTQTTYTDNVPAPA